MPWWRRAARPPWYEQPPQVELPRGRRRLSAADAGPDELHNLAMAVVLQWGPTRRIPPAQQLRAVLSEFAWIDGDNLSHLYSQACRDVVHG